MTSTTVDLPPLTAGEYKESLTIFESLCIKSDCAACITSCLAKTLEPQKNHIRILLIGAGTGSYELELLAPYQISHLTAIEPNSEMTKVLKVNLHESYLNDETNKDGIFDVILMVHCWPYVASSDHVLCQLRTLMRPQTGRLIIIVSLGCISKLCHIYAPNSPHVYDANALERKLRNLDIPFDRHPNDGTIDITDIIGDEKLEWAFTSFFLFGNAIGGGKSFATQVIADLAHMGQTTKDGRIHITMDEHVFVIPPNTTV